MPLSGVLEQLFDYWQSLPKAEGTLLPARHSLQPTDLQETLPRLSLLKRKHRYQVHVTMIRTANDNSLTSPFLGMNAFDLTPPSMRENSATLYAAILDHPSAALMTENIVTNSGKSRCILSLYLPMTDSGGSASYIVGCSVYRRQPCYASTNEHLVPTRNHVIDVEFLDIGAGLPAVDFERIEPEAEQPLSFQWWERFLPDWSKTKPDFRSHRQLAKKPPSWLAPGTTDAAPSQSAKD